jgi:hypothetical protein
MNEWPIKTKLNLFHIWLLWAALLPATLQAQFAYTSNNGSITITGHTGSGGALVLPGTISGLPVNSIGDYAFDGWAGLTSLTMPDSVTNIGNAAFQDCSFMTNIMIGNGVTCIGTNAFYRCNRLASVTFGTNLTIIEDFAFDQCSSLSKVVLPDSVASIGSWAFYFCLSLANVTMGNGITNIGEDAFYDCPDLMGIYFGGNAPSLGPEVFLADNVVVVHYLPGTKGWGPPGALFGGRPTALWPPQVQTGDASFGVRSNQFGFNITWANDAVVVVEACTNLANPAWSRVGTNTLTNGSSYFSDPRWTNYPNRFYRLHSP